VPTPHSWYDNAQRALDEEQNRRAPENIPVRGHLYVHVAACPCQPRVEPDLDYWEAERLALDRP
jgi:hypothetical protein